MRFSIPGILLLCVIGLSASPAADAADPQPYRVDISSTGDGSLDAAVRATSELVSLRTTAPVSPFGLIARARGEVDRLKTVLESFGYYQSSVSIKIEGLGLNSGSLGDVLTSLPKGQSALVAVSFNLGPLYHLRAVTVDGPLPDSASRAFTLQSGAPAVAADVLAAGARLEAALQDQGYAFAQVDTPVAYEDPSLPVLDVSFHVLAGERVMIGEIRLQGLERVHDKVVRRRLTLHTGQLYNPGMIEAARRDLLSLGPFGAISVQIGQSVDSTGGVPVTFVLRERKRHAVTVNAAYSSDLGGSGGVTWTDRNVFGNGEQLSVGATAIDLGGSSSTGIGYDTNAKFIIPDFAHRDQTLTVAVGATKQSLAAYDRKAVTSGITLTRRLSSVWTASAGIATANEQIIQPPDNSTTNAALNNKYNYTLVGVPLTVAYDSTRLASPLDDPTHGMRDSLSVTPTESLGRPNAGFVVTQINLATYFDLHGAGLGVPGRSIIAVRALAGQALGASELSLPPDQRFYAGGSGTIRGYPFQLVGPQFCAEGGVPDPKNPAKTCTPNKIPIGGTAIAAASLEFRQRFGASWGAAFFVDGGQVSANVKPLTSDFRVGAGVGLRYYTGIGPIRLDIASPSKRDRNGDDPPFQVYIGLGQAF